MSIAIPDTAPTPVVLAVDAAFALPGEPFRPVGERLVHCPVDGRSQGLSFLLDLFGWYDLTATFFVETGQVRRYGDAPMGRAVERIFQTEQDLQLLIDPRWPGGGGGCSALVDEGLAAMDRWGVPRPVAARRQAGAADPAFGRALADRDLAVPPSAAAALADRPWSGLRAALWRARRAGASALTLGLRTWDFVTARDADWHRLKTNGGAQNRLERLGSFLQENARDFRSVGLSSLVRGKS